MRRHSHDVVSSVHVWRHSDYGEKVQNFCDIPLHFLLCLTGITSPPSNSLCTLIILVVRLFPWLKIVNYILTETDEHAKMMLYIDVNLRAISRGGKSVYYCVYVKWRAMSCVHIMRAYLVNIFTVWRSAYICMSCSVIDFICVSSIVGKTKHDIVRYWSVN
jgi:hypothetical protein